MNKYYITTSLPYVNAPSHIGHALEFVQADVLARYHNLLGDDVFFLTGTDDHGIKIARKAEELGKTPQKFSDEISQKFRDLTKVFNISNDYFIRTSDKENHWPNVFEVWNKLLEQGDIEKRSYKGLYCVGCEAFIKEKELIDGKCQYHQKEPEAVEEENYFFKLSKYADKVKEAIEQDRLKITPNVRKNEILSFIDSGVEDISVSRSKENLKWGIPVPNDENQIIYIWFEALINYLYPKDYWPADVHCVGKDIFRFHSLIWPAMLLAYGKELPKNILVHGFISSGGQKMSKSLGNVVDPLELIEKYGADAVRYFLLREIPPTEDGDFSIEKFETRYNADLANGIGNTVARVLTLVEKKFNGIVPEYKSLIKSKEGEDKNLIQDYDLKRVKETYNLAIQCYEFNGCLKAIIDGFTIIDQNIHKKKPWEENFYSNENFANYCFYTWLEFIRVLAYLLLPFIPETSKKIFDQLGLDVKIESGLEFEEATKWGRLKSGDKINFKKGEYLFPRINKE